ADAGYVRLPAELSWDRIINFAVFKNVDYIVAGGGLLNDPRFCSGEFMLPKSPVNLLRAILKNRAVHFHGAATPIGLLNKLLEYRDLYKFMPLQPEGSK